ncbi:hemolysin family protein [Magnetospira sp. QH-2]|uniref:hemolysin family protein n=1 Tax=Magnetospira sp. (strain QH-2) TaxID=1288970 RepID=UPI0003E80BF6|nr:hemolysin family protein [Magnetospira sp. QH-2]CCQ75711.1 putative hemolysin C [Magnetospira sp. QH-2]
MNDDTSPPPPTNGHGAANGSLVTSLRDWWRDRRPVDDPENSLKAAIGELIEEHEESAAPIAEQEKILLDNILSLRERTMGDVMVPRADIIALECGTSFVEVVECMVSEGHSRLPVFRENLDEAIGMVHIKDALGWWDRQEEFDLSKVVRDLLFVSPSMRVLELLLEMRVSRCHLALVVDEYGGIDGLVTIEDLVEEIVGEIEDEHDRDEEPSLQEMPDGSFETNARLSIEDFEEAHGHYFADEEHEDVDTLGGLVFALVGRVPIRGELVSHASGIEFEILDADPRRIRRLRIRLPAAPAKPD